MEKGMVLANTYEILEEIGSGGAVVTEQVFGWPGIGSLMVTAINGRDYPVIMGITVMIAAAVLIANILTDVAYGILDPRISYK